jgi:hypothetical protein
MIDNRLDFGMRAIGNNIVQMQKMNEYLGGKKERIINIKHAYFVVGFICGVWLAIIINMAR